MLQTHWYMPPIHITICAYMIFFFLFRFKWIVGCDGVWIGLPFIFHHLHLAQYLNMLCGHTCLLIQFVRFFFLLLLVVVTAGTCFNFPISYMFCFCFSGIFFVSFLFAILLQSKPRILAVPFYLLFDNVGMFYSVMWQQTLSNNIENKTQHEICDVNDFSSFWYFHCLGQNILLCKT